MHRCLILLALLLTLTMSLFGQGSISGTISASGEGNAGATISLLNASDSLWLRSVMSENNGAFNFAGVTKGNYLLNVTAAGYKTTWKSVSSDGAENIDLLITVEKEEHELGAVTVTVKKPFIEMSIGKITVNIEGSATTASSNALDLLRRLPGVAVDPSGNISMNGKDGLLVLIDNRPTYLSGEELASYLKTITADDISKLELITQPGARYDAAGNMGVINIALKRNKKQGWNGSVTASAGQGVYFHRNESAVVSYKKDKLSLMLTADDMEAKGFADWTEDLYFIDQHTGTITSKSALSSNPIERFSNTALRIGADYSLTDKTKIGTSVRGSYHPNTMPFGLFSTDSDIIKRSLSYRNDHTDDHSLKKDITANAYLAHKFSSDHTLDINVDYLRFSKMADESYTSNILDDNMQPTVAPYVVRSHQPLMINVYTLKADYARTLKNGIKLEAGAKTSFVNTDYDVAFGQLSNGVWTNDTGRTNHFVYRENINAAYVTINKTLGKKWEARLGLRAEQTISEGIQYVGSSTFSRNYLSPFPTAYITYKPDSLNQFELNYGRRIDRPSYRQLNPYAFYSFQNTYQEGNSFLQPQYTNNIELKHGWKNMVFTSVTYSSTTDVITELLEVRGVDRTVYNVERNLASNSYVSGKVIFNKDVFKWFSLNANASVFAAEYSGPVNNVPKTVHWSGYSFDAGGQLDFGKGWKAEFFVNYYSAGRRDINEAFEGHVYMECGASKRVNDKFLLRFYANDPFWLDVLHIHNNAGNFREDVFYRYASQLFSLSATFTFGSKPDQEHRQNDVEEARRL